MKINAASTLNLEENVRFASVNGCGRIFPGQTMPEEKVFLVVNGALDIEPGSEDILKNYAGIMVNGALTCPESMTGLLSSITVNGATKTYPDGSIRLKKIAVLQTSRSPFTRRKDTWSSADALSEVMERLPSIYSFPPYRFTRSSSSTASSST